MFSELVSVVHQGTTVTFGRNRDEPGHPIYYNVLGLNVDSASDTNDWTGFKKLTFPPELRPVGMSLVTLADGDVPDLGAADVPFHVVTDQKRISVVRQSTRGTLLVDRFLLARDASGPRKQTTEYVLSPVWEVRFERSGQESVPADRSDRQTYLAPDGKPFLEPTLELAMVTEVSAGGFDVLMLPVRDSSRIAWQFVVHNAKTGNLDLYNFPATDNGLFDVSAKPLTDSFRIAPDASFSLAAPGGTELVPEHAPSAVLYMKHERARTADGRGFTVKRAARVLIAVAGRVAGTRVMGLVDAAVSNTGRLAQVRGKVEASTIQPANYALAFDSVANVELVPTSEPNPLAISGPYELSFWMNPAKLGDRSRCVIGGDSAVEPERRAPYVTLTDDLRLSFGFGNGTNAVACSTAPIPWKTDAWYHVRLVYAGKGKDPFQLFLNESLVPLSPCETDAEPAGTPISVVSPAGDGFEGQLDEVEILVGKTPACRLPFDSVDYAVRPPVTPNTAEGSPVRAEVHGAKLTLSTSPVEHDTTGMLHVDPDGLTWYSGIADFLRAKATPKLLEGADALVHLYFQGEDDTFSVAELSASTQRATYVLDWRAAASNGGAEAGTLELVGQRAGTLLNRVNGTVVNNAAPVLCDAKFDDAVSGTREVWNGLPRSLLRFSAALNGTAVSDPNAPSLLDGTKTFFDYDGRYPQVVLPVRGSDEGACFHVVSRLPGVAPLHAVSVVSGGAGNLATLSLGFRPKHWTAKDTRITQTWPDVERSPSPLVQTFAGTNPSYDYRNVTSEDTAVYGLVALLPRADGQVSRPVVFVRKEGLPEFWIAVTSAPHNPDFCEVDVAGIELSGVPREQNAFADVLNGTAPDYPYPADYKTRILPNLYVLTDGLTAAVQDGRRDQPDPNGALAFSSLFRVFYAGRLGEATELADMPETAASIVQSATLTAGGKDRSLNAGSSIFGASATSIPTQGGTALVENTSKFSDGIAPLFIAGTNGGWVRESPDFALEFNTEGRSNRLAFDVTRGFAPVESLSIRQDLTLELWLNSAGAPASGLSRAVTYHVTGRADAPNESFRYLAGLKRGPALKIGDRTFVKAAYNFAPPEVTLQLYVKVTSEQKQGRLASVAPVQSSDRYLTLELDMVGRPVLTYGSDTATVTGDRALENDRSTLLTATVRKAGDGSIELALYVDGEPPKTATASPLALSSLGVLQVGSATSQALRFSVNGASLWNRALTPEDVSATYLRDYADNAPGLLIRWNFTEGIGTTAFNAAASGGEYDGPILNPETPAWDDAGTYEIPYAGRNDLVFQAGAIARSWTHLAYAYRQGRGLSMEGKAFARAESSDSLSLDAKFSIEAWLLPAGGHAKAQVIVEKGENYALRLDGLNRVLFSTRLRSGASERTFTVASSPLADAEAHYVVCTFESGSVPQNAGDPTKPVYPKYYARASLFVDGKKVQSTFDDGFTDTVQVVTNKDPFLLGKSRKDDFYYEGKLGGVRLWQRLLDDGEIARVAELHELPANGDGLLSAWTFEEATGKTAHDTQGENPLVLSDNDLWCLFEEIARAKVYVDGRRVPVKKLGAAAVGGYGDPQFTVGALVDGGAATQLFRGVLDEIRVWNVELTEEQISDSMNRQLAGNEPALAGYWRFDIGSGTRVYDQTGRGNNASFVPNSVDAGPQWRESSAPLSDEAAPVYNVLGGVRTEFTSTLEGTASVVEYADTQKDAYGNVFSVLKRAYLYDTSGRTVLLTGYKVGDLDTLFLGQVQTRPTVVGFIEGGPPVPSENQTIAYWTSSVDPTNPYTTASSVSLSTDSETTYRFSGNRGFKVGGGFTLKGGPSFKGKFGVSAGVGAEAEAQTGEYEVKVGPKVGVSGAVTDGDGVQTTHTSTTKISQALSPGGGWEPENQLLNPVVGRRYVTENLGVAVVKSTTADLYMVAVKGTQTAVKYSLVPNRDIPEDVNLIEFPINPGYVKNGTLDGKVGLESDPDFGGERRSYFNPVQAYALKRTIEKQGQQLQALYDQFDTNNLRLLGSLERVKDKLGANPAYDFAADLGKRSLANTYVWSAGGGLYKEEHGTLDVYSETYSGASNLELSLGLSVEGKTDSPAGGYFVEFDALGSTSFEMSVQKSKDRNAAFALTASVAPSGFLGAPILTHENGRLAFKGYTELAAPGKVDSYRFLAFFLAPSEANFRALASVVDPNWLGNSAHANAAALREATAAENGAWRILYRTTFVSRVPAEFQPTNADAPEPAFEPPANPTENSWLVRVVERQLESGSPTPLEIGEAVDATLGRDASNPGVLGTLLPWWPDFLSLAETFGSDQYRRLVELRGATLQYLIDTFEAKSFEPKQFRSTRYVR